MKTPVPDYLNHVLSACHDNKKARWRIIFLNSRRLILTSLDLRYQP